MNYPKWWNDTITVYNKYLDNDRIAKFQRKVITGCFYSTRLITNTQNGDILIPSNYGVRVRENKDYVSYMEWTPNEEGKFTFNAGDIIIKGNVEDEIDDGVRGKL